MPMNRDRVVNVASVKHRSVFRYPGGKTWFVPYVHRWLGSRGAPAAHLVEPFAGGGIVGLTVAFEQWAERVTLVELDDAIAAVWRTLLGGRSAQLAERIQAFDVTLESVRAVLDAKPRTLVDQAFATIVRNRMQRGGIMAPGASLMKSGEAGKGLKSRWYADTLARRIHDISRIRRRLDFRCSDGVQTLRDHAEDASAVFFIDPPYTVAGRRLYAHSELDHEELFRVASTLRGDFLMTYDDAAPVRGLAAEHGFDTERVVMKNTHHTVKHELLIGRDLDWLGARNALESPN